MGVILVDGEDVSFDTTLLDLSTVTDGAVPDRYTGVPEGTRPLLFTTDGRDDFEFRRDATAQEKSALSKRTGIPESRINANLESERGGFVVADVEADDDDYTVLQLDDFVFHEVSPSVVADATVVDDPVTPDLSWWCRYKCGNCLAKAAKCLGCCVATSLGCIVCIIWQCGLGAKSCYDCHGCLK